MNNQRREKKVCLIIGAGAGIGGAITKKFASEGYHVCFARRSDQNALINMEKDLKSCGYSASGYILDVTKEDTIEELVGAPKGTGTKQEIVRIISASIIIEDQQEVDDDEGA